MRFLPGKDDSPGADAPAAAPMRGLRALRAANGGASSLGWLLAALRTAELALVNDLEVAISDLVPLAESTDPRRLATVGAVADAGAHVAERFVEVVSTGRYLQAGVIATVLARLAASRQRVLRQVALQAQVVEGSAEGILIADSDGIVCEVNPAFERMTRCSSEELVGQPVKRLRPPNPPRGFVRGIWQEVQVVGEWTGEVDFKRKEADPFPARARLSTIQADSSEQPYIVGTIADLTDERRARDLVAQRESEDPLTGIANRSQLTSRLARALDDIRRGRTPHVGLMLVNVDQFSNINELYGHDGGDALLQQVAQRLSAVLSGDQTISVGRGMGRGAMRTVGRYGGDEFVVLLSSVADERSVGIIADWRALGVTLAIDDFGTGFSSLAYLKRFPLDTLKVDKAFVTDIPTERENAAIVEAIVALARSLELEVVAEGVETEAEASRLRKIGVDFFQGWLYAKAMPANECLQWLEARR